MWSRVPFAPVHRHLVAPAEGAAELEDDAGQEVGQDALAGEGEGQATDAERSNQGPDSHADHPEGVEERDAGRRRAHDAAHRLGRRSSLLLLLLVAGRSLHDPAHHGRMTPTTTTVAAAIQSPAVRDRVTMASLGPAARTSRSFPTR